MISNPREWRDIGHPLENVFPVDEPTLTLLQSHESAAYSWAASRWPDVPLHIGNPLIHYWSESPYSLMFMREVAIAENDPVRTLYIQTSGVHTEVQGVPFSYSSISVNGLVTLRGDEQVSRINLVTNFQVLPVFSGQLTLYDSSRPRQSTASNLRHPLKTVWDGELLTEVSDPVEVAAGLDIQLDALTIPVCLAVIDLFVSRKLWECTQRDEVSSEIANVIVGLQ